MVVILYICSMVYRGIRKFINLSERNIILDAAWAGILRFLTL